MLKLIKYVLFLSLLLVSGCKLKHAFRGQEIVIYSYKDEGNVKVGKIDHQEMKEIEQMIKRDREGK